MNSKPAPAADLRAATSFLLAAALAPSALHAASGTWTGATDADWSVASNWSAAPVPGTGDTATFNNAGNGNTMLAVGPVTVSQIIFDTPDAASYTLGSGTITLNGGGAIRANANLVADQTVSAGIVLGVADAASAYTFNASRVGGSLALSGGITGNATAGLKTLNLSGIGAGFVSGAISDGTGATAVTKNDSGTWTLSGANTFTGALTIQKGTVIADYSGGSDVFGSANAVNLGWTGSAASNAPGVLVFKGQSSGGTADTIGNLVFSSAANRLVTNNNGGSGTVITLGPSITRSGGSGFLTFDTSAGGSFVIGAGTLGGSIAGRAEGDLLGDTMFVVDGVGRGDFASYNASREIVRLNATTDLPAAGGSATADYRVNAATPAITAATAARTIRVDASGGAVALATGGFISSNAWVFEGANNITVTGRLNAANATSNIHLLGTGVTEITGTITSGAFQSRISGTGLLVLSGAQSNTSDTRLQGGVLRATSATNPISSGLFNINGGIFEIGNDLNGATVGDFSRSFNTAAGANIDLQGDGGFSAHGGDRVLVAGGASAQSLTWGTTAGFFNQTANNNSRLVLSSVTSDSRLEFRNNINFNGAQRVVDTRNGSAATDALLSGVLSGTGASGLTKTGTGTLELTNANTYSGGTYVTEGRLLVNNTSGSGTGSGDVIINTSAIVGGSGTIAGTIRGGGLVAAGNGLGILTAGAVDGSDGLDFSFGMTGLDPDYDSPTISINDVLRLTSGIPFTTSLAGSNTVTVDFSSLSLNFGDLIRGAFFANTDFYSDIENANFQYVGLGGYSVDVSTVPQDADFGGGTVSGYVTQFAIVPEPSTVLLLGLGLSGMFLRRRPRHG